MTVGPVPDFPAELCIAEPIPAGHKLALRERSAGQPVFRYGQVIGWATQPIKAGQHVHMHNLGIHDSGRDAAAAAAAQPVAPVPKEEHRTFLGFERPDGRVGTRNFIAIISTVNCSAHAARKIARHFTDERLAAYPNVDGVIALTHPYGCPNEQKALQRTLAGMAHHPNVGAYVLTGLGCETNQAAGLAERFGLCAGPQLVIQELGGLQKTFEAGVTAVERLLPDVNAVQRVPRPLSDLILAMQCGGSDSWSGVTANPAIGLMADTVIRQGGTVVLAETPEIFGAEHLLAARAVNPDIQGRLIDLVRWWEGHAERLGLRLDANRSIGNAAGGLTTIYEKSLGAIAKGGSTPLTAVVAYAEAVSGPGLVFMDSPGYDPMSVTGEVAGGCNLVLFSTGRGSVFGFKPAPCIKISSHSELYRRMPDDMDLDAGRILAGADPSVVADELLDLVIEVASGRQSKSEAQGIGEAEFCPWNVEGVL